MKTGPSNKQNNQFAGGWSLWVRLTHWLVAVCVLADYFNETGFWHRLIGYSCLSLVLLRIAHGFWPQTRTSSRFYFPGFNAVKRHLHNLRTGKLSLHSGHNPLGQWAVYAMWLLIILLGFTGWLSRTDAYWGEDWPIDWHGYFSNALIALVLLHILAALIMSKISRKNLVKQMVTGKEESLQ